MRNKPIINDKLTLIPLNNKDLEKYDGKISYKKIDDIPFACGIIKDHSVTLLSDESIRKTGLSFNTLFKYITKNMDRKDYNVLSAKADIPLYCITNKKQLYGAGVLARIDIIEDIAKKYDVSNIMVIPSSKNDIIIADLDLCNEMGLTLNDITGLISDINSNESLIKKDDILSYNLYVIKDGQLETATEKDFSINKDEENSFEL